MQPPLWTIFKDSGSLWDSARYTLNSCGRFLIQFLLWRVRPETGSPTSNEDKWSDRASWQHLKDISYTSVSRGYRVYTRSSQSSLSTAYVLAHRLFHMLFHHNTKALPGRFEGKKEVRTSSSIDPVQEWKINTFCCSRCNAGVGVVKKENCM